MIEAYTISNTGGQASSKSAIIIPCDLPRDGQRENGSAEDAAPYVLEAAQQYSSCCLQNTGGDMISLENLQNTEIRSKIFETDATVCAFDVSAEAPLVWVKSGGTHVAGADRSEGSLVDLLNAQIWTYLADTWVLDTDKIKLLSGNTCMSLSLFKDALELLVNDNVTHDLHSTGAIKETVFWKRLMQPAAPFSSTKPSYSHASSGRRSGFNTVPRRSESPFSRVRSPSLFVPRTMPAENPSFTDQFTRNAG